MEHPKGAAAHAIKLSVGPVRKLGWGPSPSQRSGGGLVDNATTGAGKAATDMTTDDPKKPDWRAGDSDGARLHRQSTAPAP
jgi:hypothetical protein